jgi:hypothetical protein
LRPQQIETAKQKNQRDQKTAVLHSIPQVRIKSKPSTLQPQAGAQQSLSFIAPHNDKRTELPARNSVPKIRF